MVTSTATTAAATLYDNLINSIGNETTKRKYAYLLDKYMKYQKYDSIENLLPLPSPPQQQDIAKVIESNIIRYVIWLKNDQKLSVISINQYIAAVTHFYAMNDVMLNRKKISRYMGDYIRTNKDRAYTYQEITKLLEFCDERAKALVLLLASSGVRIGSTSNLILRNLKKIDAYRLYQVIIYEGTKEEY
jgi:integrase